MAKDLIIRSSTEEFITFKLQEKDKGIQVRYENETLWMTQKAMAELFDVEQPAIAKHLINIYNEKELDKDSTYSKMELVKKEGNRSVKRNIEFYNLDAIISVGYRVNSLRATQFRRWATNILKTFTIQRYVLDKKRMKNGSFIDKDYFEKLLEEIREIMISERRFYQKVTDIYATSIDYDSKYSNGKIMESDVIIAKNYLNKEELIAQLNINDDRANEIYDVIMEFVSSKIKEKKSNMLLNRMIRVDQKIFALFMT